MADKPGADGGLRELALFAGAGGGILGGHLLGWRTICAVEHDPYAASVLCARQNDGLLPPFPIWDDVRTFDGRPWRGLVDVVSGGFPCQDISAAGKGAGIGGERSGLWLEMARIIGEVRPRYVFVENSPVLTSRGLGIVLGDLAALGFDARWGVLGAADVGAPHLRERIWIRAERRAEQPCWIPCPDCGEFWCNLHDMHAFECECPPVDEWRTDPYSDPMFIGLEDCEREWTAEDPEIGAIPPGGSLNPTWVEWLMGWPLGWTDLRPSATGRCRNARPWPSPSWPMTDPS